MDLGGSSITVLCHTLRNHAYISKNHGLGWQNAGGDGKHLDLLKAMELHTHANHVEAAQSWHANKASPLDGEC